MGSSYDKSGQFVERGLGYRRGLIVLIIAAFAALVALLPWVRPAGAAAGQPDEVQQGGGKANQGVGHLIDRGKGHEQGNGQGHDKFDDDDGPPPKAL